MKQIRKIFWILLNCFLWNLNHFSNVIKLIFFCNLFYKLKFNYVQKLQWNKCNLIPNNKPLALSTKVLLRLLSLEATHIFVNTVCFMFVFFTVSAKCLKKTVNFCYLLLFRFKERHSENPSWKVLAYILILFFNLVVK